MGFHLYSTLQKSENSEWLPEVQGGAKEGGGYDCKKGSTRGS